MSYSHTRALPEHTIVHRAALHSVREGDCLIWHGHTQLGVPYMALPGKHRFPTGERTTMSVRQAILIELGVPKPDRCRSTTTTCGDGLCVEPTHCRWEPWEDYRLRMRAMQRSAITVDQVREAWERREAGENVSALARELGISRQGLYRQWDRWIKGVPG